MTTPAKYDSSRVSIADLMYLKFGVRDDGTYEPIYNKRIRDVQMSIATAQFLESDEALDIECGADRIIWGDSWDEMEAGISDSK